MWDANFFKPNEIIGEAVLDLYPFFEEVCAHFCWSSSYIEFVWGGREKLCVCVCVRERERVLVVVFVFWS